MDRRSFSLEGFPFHFSGALMVCMYKKKWRFSLIGMADHLITTLSLISKQNKQNHIFSTMYLVLFHQLRPKEIAQQVFLITNLTDNS